MPKVTTPESQPVASVNTGNSRRYDLIVPHDQLSVRMWGVITDVRHGWIDGKKGPTYYIKPSVRLFNQNHTELDMDRIVIGWYNVEEDFIGFRDEKTGEIVPDPVSDDPDKQDSLWGPYYWTIAGLGFHNGEGGVNLEHSRFFLEQVLPTKHIDPEGEHTPESALAGAIVYVSVVTLPYTKRDGQKGERNAIGFKLKEINGRKVPQGGWLVPQLDRFEEWLEEPAGEGLLNADAEPILNREAYDLGNWSVDEQSRIIFQSPEDQERFWELVDAGPAAPFDNDPASVFA